MNTKSNEPRSEGLDEGVRGVVKGAHCGVQSSRLPLTPLSSASALVVITGVNVGTQYWRVS